MDLNKVRNECTHMLGLRKDSAVTKEFLQHMECGEYNRIPQAEDIGGKASELILEFLKDGQGEKHKTIMLALAVEIAEPMEEWLRVQMVNLKVLADVEEEERRENILWEATNDRRHVEVVYKPNSPTPFSVERYIDKNRVDFLHSSSADYHIALEEAYDFVNNRPADLQKVKHAVLDMLQKRLMEEANA